MRPAGSAAPAAIRSQQPTPAALLEYAQTVARLPPDGLTTELLRAEQRFHDHPDGGNRVRLALVLSVPGSGAENQKQAMSLLAPLQGPNADPELRPLAIVLSEFLARLAHLREQLKASRDESALLHRQLQSLTTIERHIQKRDVPEDLHGR